MDLLFEDNHIDLVMELISKYDICLECLGRQFALVGTGFKNTERAQRLLEIITDKIDTELSRTLDKDVDVFHRKINELININYHINFQGLKILLESIDIN
jgi:tRNA U54 and U55 pseudouridine synthase Pus10